jgi:hypothetical protein
MRKFEVLLNVAGREIAVKCALKSPKVAEAYMDLILKGKTKQAIDLLFNEVVENKEELQPLLERYPLLKAAIVTKVAEALGMVTDAEIRELEEGKNG